MTNLRITTWNLQGRERPDIASVASVLRDLGSDIAVLQEVQRRQAHDLASALGWAVEWRWKHWPLVIPAEGMAIISSNPLIDVQTVALAHRRRFWSSRRRVALGATVAGIRVVNVHLGSGVRDQERARQALRVMELCPKPGPAVVAGDFNALPDEVATMPFAAAGFAEAWSAHGRDPLPTFLGRKRRSGPVRPLDYLITRSLRVVDSPVVGSGPESDWQAFRSLSDHAPVTAQVSTDCIGLA